MSLLRQQSPSTTTAVMTQYDLPTLQRRSYIGRYVRTSAGTFTPSLIWPTERMMSSPSSWAKQA